MPDLAAQLFNTDKPFCIINKKEDVSLYFGEVKKYSLIKDLPPVDKEGDNYIAILPYNQIKERGYDAVDEGEKILTLLINEKQEYSKEEFLKMLPEHNMELEGGLSYNLDDDEFMEGVERVIKNEINFGEGSNFLFSRKTFGKIKEFTPELLLSVLKKLMINEFNSHWNFLYYTGDLFFIGASPERHMSYEENKLIMNPICGTLPKLDGKDFQERMIDFIHNPKEINELFQVVDEELKIICKLCPEGGKILGPFLKEMGSVVHTEYYLEGKGEVDIFWGLKESLYAATMVGSPLESAARVITRFEKDSRRYYSSIICLFGKNENDKLFFDSAITIRTMELDKQGKFTLQCGASIVRDSVPELECHEIKAKAAGSIKAMLEGKIKNKPLLPDFINEKFLNDFNSRNDKLSTFWFSEYKGPSIEQKYKIIFIDNEDDFIYMLSHMMNRMGYKTEIIRYNKFDIKNYNEKEHIIVVGPGPGNPNNLNDPKIKILYDAVKNLLNSEFKVLGVCLGHQIISKVLGFTLTKSIIPSQGMQKRVDFMEKKEYVGFYNSFFAIKDSEINEEKTDLKIEYDDKDKIIYIQGKNFVSVQFHVESILTQNGIEILSNALNYLTK